MLNSYNITSTSVIDDVIACLRSRYGALVDVSFQPKETWQYHYNEVNFGTVKLGIVITDGLVYTRNFSDELIICGVLSGTKKLTHGNLTRVVSTIPVFEPPGRVSVDIKNATYWIIRACPKLMSEYVSAVNKTKSLSEIIKKSWGLHRSGGLELHDLVMYIINRIERFGLPGEEELKLVEKLIYCCLVRLVNEDLDNNKHEMGYKTFAKCLEYIDEKIEGKITASDLALIANCSVRSLQYMFNRIVGCSVMKFVMERRLSRARMILQSGSNDISVALTCMAVGIENESYFSKIYFAKFGELPSKTLQRSK